MDIQFPSTPSWIATFFHKKTQQSYKKLRILAVLLTYIEFRVHVHWMLNFLLYKGINFYFF